MSSKISKPSEKTQRIFERLVCRQMIFWGTAFKSGSIPYAVLKIRLALKNNQEQRKNV